MQNKLVSDLGVPQVSEAACFWQFSLDPCGVCVLSLYMLQIEDQNMHFTFREGKFWGCKVILAGSHYIKSLFEG